MGAAALWRWHDAPRRALAFTLLAAAVGFTGLVRSSRIREVYAASMALAFPVG